MLKCYNSIPYCPQSRRSVQTIAYMPELYTKHLFAVGQYLCYNIRIHML